MGVTEIDSLPAAYAAAVGGKDVDAFAALYAEDVRVFDLWGSWSYDGLAAWRNAAEEWFRSLGDERVAVHFAEARVGERSLSAFVTYRGLSAAGEDLRAMVNRLTWVLERRDDEWKIVHEHTSAPAGLEDGKVQLSRE
jgi:uncharacterized protein (TIGR02246 family)